MLKQIIEHNKYVEITGFRGIKIENTVSLLKSLNEILPKDIEIQFFNADCIATWEHLYFAAINAIIALKNKRNLSKSLAVETVLYASAQRQIKKAIEAIGVKSTTQNIAITIIGEKPDSIKNGLHTVINHFGIEPEETVLELSKSKIPLIRRIFDISETELKTIGNNFEEALVYLVIEHIALLSTQV